MRIGSWKVPFTKAPDVPLQGTTTMPLMPFMGVTTTDSLVKMYGTVGWVFACAALISSRVGAVQWGAFKPKGGGEVEQVEHPALDLLNNPNPFMSAMELIELSTIYFDLAGEFFWNIVTPGAAPTELWPINPANMTEVPDRKEFLKGWIHTVGRTKTALDVDQVLHQRRPDPLNPYRGQSIIESIAIDASSDLNVSKWVSNFFRNSAQPGGVIETPATLTRKTYERLKEEWEDRHQGLSQSHRVTLLEGGMQYKPNEVHLRNLQVDAIRDMNEKIILAAFNVSPANLGIVDDVNRANAEAAAFQLAVNVIDPRLFRIKEALNRQLVPLFGETDIFLNYVSPIPLDMARENKKHLDAWNGGLTRRDTALAGLGLAIEGGPVGEEFKVAAVASPFGLSMGVLPTPTGTPIKYGAPARLQAGDPDWTGPPATDVVEPVFITETRVKEDPPDPDEPLLRAFVDTISPRERAMRKFLIEEFEAQERDTIQALREQDTRTFSRLSFPTITKIDVTDIFDEARWIASAAAGGEPHVEGALLEAAAQFAAKYSFAFDEERDEVVLWIGRRMERFSKSITTTTQKAIEAQLIDGQALGEGIPELTKRVQSVFEDASKRRAQTIARTEMVSANNQGKIESAVQSEIVVAKVWVAALDERVRDTHSTAHGQEVKLRENFDVGADSMPAPGGGNLPEENINCRCTWREVLDDTERSVSTTAEDFMNIERHLRGSVSPHQNGHFGGTTDAKCPTCKHMVQRNMPLGITLFCTRCNETFRVDGG